MCGFEEVTHPPMEPEFRPTPTPDPAGTEPPFYGGLETLGDIEKILIGGNPRLVKMTPMTLTLTQACRFSLKAWGILWCTWTIPLATF